MSITACAVGGEEYHEDRGLPSSLHFMKFYKVYQAKETMGLLTKRGAYADAKPLTRAQAVDVPMATFLSQIEKSLIACVKYALSTLWSIMSNRRAYDGLARFCYFFPDRSRSTRSLGPITIANIISSQYYFAALYVFLEHINDKQTALNFPCTNFKSPNQLSDKFAISPSVPELQLQVYCYKYCPWE